MTEFMMALSTFILRVLIILAVGVVMEIVLPWLRETAIPWLKEKRLYSMCCQFVRAAEKLADTGAIAREEKKSYVIELLVKKGIAITPDVNAMIESAVLEMDIAIEEAFGEIIHEFEDEIIFEEDDEEADAEDEETTPFAEVEAELEVNN